MSSGHRVLRPLAARSWQLLCHGGASLLDLLWPTPCPLCGEDLSIGDRDAWSKPGACGVGRALVHRSCVRRLRRRSARPMGARTWAAGVPVQAWLHDGPELFGLLHRAKYGGEADLLDALARIWGQEVTAPSRMAKTYLVPMPDDPVRRRERGFGATTRLAEALSGTWNVPIATGLLRRRSGGTAQAKQTDDADRRRNVEGRFATGDLSRVPPDAVLILVEDQVTSGATLAAALALLGVRGHRMQVHALAASARAPRGVGP